MNLELSIEQDIQVLSKYKLTCLELFFIKCLHLASNGDQYNNLENFLTSYVNEINLKDLLQSLVDKKVINQSSLKINTLELLQKYPTNIIFNKNFEKAYLIDASVLFEEVWNHYPFNVYINGSPVDLRLINSKEYRNATEVAIAYAKLIKFNKETHNRIIEALDYAVQNNLIYTNIVTFIISKGWERIWRIMEGEDSNLTFNNVTVL